MADERPAFRSTRRDAVPASPEELFYALSGRTSTHGYLRGPQQDVLRKYREEAVDARDVALELPTGTGKSAAGLLIAEWRRRRSGSPVAYLSLTNQLAKQVLQEAARLGIPCADIAGSKADREPAEVGRYRTGEAVGVTTYSNLFNINPVVQESDLLVFDDAHGGGQHVVGLWEARVRSTNSELFNALASSLMPSLSDVQVQRLRDPDAYQTVELCDIAGHPECADAMTALLNESGSSDVRFAWPLIRTHLAACSVLISNADIVIRPVLPPTFTHPQFADSAQRIYMSATLGSEDDLKREYGIQSVYTLRAEHAQWGRRYIFVPAMYCEGDVATAEVAAVLDEMSPRRAVALSPSQRSSDVTHDALTKLVSRPLTRLTAFDIADSLDPFTREDSVILTIAGRYDGLDLPDDECRLLIMSETPSAVGELERQLRDQWRLGPLLRSRERTRLVQGLGRCTRSATDYAIVFWLGQSFINAASDRRLIDSMPDDIRAELKWGLEQSKFAKEPQKFAAMIRGLLGEASYRSQADDSIGEYRAALPSRAQLATLEVGQEEVRFGEHLWGADYVPAYQQARSIADKLSTDELAGYRAWWWYLASTTARAAGDLDAEADCLARAMACGINSAWLRWLVARRGKIAAPSVEYASNAESVWRYIEQLGTAGPTFDKRQNLMLEHLAETAHPRFHEGLDELGRAVGAIVTRSKEQGAPDVVWSFSNDDHAAFEAKSEKDPTGTLSKSDVLQAAGHANWVKAKLASGSHDLKVIPIVASPTKQLNESAAPHAEGLYYLSLDDCRGFGSAVKTALAALRAKYAGHDFASCRGPFSADLRSSKLDADSVLRRLASTKLTS